MVFKNNNQIETGYFNEIDTTYMIFKQQVNEDDFIEYHQELLDEFNTLKYTSGKHLVDTSPLKIISSSCRKWVAEKIVPRIHQTSNRGKAYIAVVLGKNTFINPDVHHIDPKYNENVHIHYFSKMDDAKMWLSSMHHSNCPTSLTG